jgi:HrpA-like RNA helicase
MTVILMSATVEANQYAEYFSEYPVGLVHIEGRTFPVQDIHLEWILSTTGYRPPLRKLRGDRDRENEDFENGIGNALDALNEGALDYELIAQTVKLICDENKDSGGILIFLPGSPVSFTKLIFRHCRDLPMH